MTKKSKLSRRQQSLVTEWMHMVQIAARQFVRCRPSWQKALYVDELEGEGYLALVKAARTYDPKRLPYPKAYFARAALNAMLKHIKRATRAPGDRVSLDDAEESSPQFDELDHLRIAIEQLPPDEMAMAVERFVSGSTIKELSASRGISMKVASLRARRLAKILAESLDIQQRVRRQVS
ncbi:MAG: sigma-70 family RNA polymerase sigma factor [Betaproteobacteria bacterium]|nr:sigma-70 family RNA polymerase sigma factor [Betaproteobacteria bacterium]NCA16932.1 sigma-70 family RNA polymerase sigma factor [Betaproteobacteria bacterium]